MDLFNLQGTTSVVIGGNGVLGSAMASALAAYGSKVSIVGRNMEKAEAVKQKIEQEGGEVICLQADATSKADLEAVLDEVLKWSGRVDTLVNASGVNSSTPFFELEMEEWDRIMDTNLKSVVLACQIFGKQMIEQGEGGSIINISSVSSGPPLSRVFTYSASKAGVNSVTQFLAREFAPHRSRECDHPGLLPGGTESQDPRCEPHRIDHAPYADGTFRRAGRIARRGRLSGFSESIRFVTGPFCAWTVDSGR